MKLKTTLLALLTVLSFAGHAQFDFDFSGEVSGEEAATAYEDYSNEDLYDNEYDSLIDDFKARTINCTGSYVVEKNGRNLHIPLSIVLDISKNAESAKFNFKNIHSAKHFVVGDLPNAWSVNMNFNSAYLIKSEGIGSPNDAYMWSSPADLKFQVHSKNNDSDVIESEVAGSIQISFNKAELDVGNNDLEPSLNFQLSYKHVNYVITEHVRNAHNYSHVKCHQTIK